MNKFQRVGLAALAAVSMSYAQGSLWGPNADDFPSLQVKTPEVESYAGGPGYDVKAGFWFGYTDQTATTQVRKSGTFVPFGEGVGITNEDDGSSLIDPSGLFVKLNTGAAASTEAPAIAGIGFNMTEEGLTDADISAKKGYCISYASDGEVQFELGWDEPTYNYDTWIVKLPAAPNGSSIKMTWTGTQSAKIAGDFSKEGWGTGTKSQPIETATQKSRSLKIRNKNGGQSPVDVNFAIAQLGWYDDNCNGTVSVADISPIIGSNVAKSNVNFSMMGRMVSMSVKEPTTVQVISLQGAVVHTQTLTSTSTMNLSKLPTGIYMLRAPALGYTNRILLK